MKKIIEQYKKELEAGTLTKESLYYFVLMIQHERLVHLLVTILTAIVFFVLIAVILFIKHIVTDLLFICVACFLFCYIHYYCYIENQTQFFEKTLVEKGKEISDSSDQ